MSRTKVTFLCGVGAFKLSIVSKKLKKFWCVFYVSVFVSDELFIASSIRSSRSEYYVTAWIQPTVTASTNAGDIFKWKKEVCLLFSLLSFGNDEEKKTLCLSFSILFLFLLKILLEKTKKEGTKDFLTKNKWKIAWVILTEEKSSSCFLLTFRFQFSPNKGRSKGNSRSRLDNRRKQHFFVGSIIKAFFFFFQSFTKESHYILKFETSRNFWESKKRLWETKSGKTYFLGKERKNDKNCKKN